MKVPAVARRSLRTVLPWAPRLLSLGSLPDALIIGAQRGGTTSLEMALRDHPGIRGSRFSKKEVHFFDTAWPRGEDWYRAHFPSERRRQRYRREHGSGLVAIEATPYYLFHPDVPRRAAMTVPDVRLIAVLRDPVERAFSQYKHEVRIHAETAPTFEAALELEEVRLRGEEERLLEDERYVSFAHQHHSYVARGRYAEQLERWADRFPREQMLVLTSERLFHDSTATLRTILRFLGSDATHPPALPNEGGTRATPMQPDTRASLRTAFGPSTAALADWLGHDPGWDA